MAAKKIPLRMCVACRRMKPKQALYKFSRTPDGPLSPEPRAQGRSAYVCLDNACIDKALKNRGFERALGRAPTDEQWSALRELAEKYRTESDL